MAKSLSLSFFSFFLFAKSLDPLLVGVELSCGQLGLLLALC